MGEPERQQVYMIARWFELYEPRSKEGGSGALKYFQWRAHPHCHTCDYRDLMVASTKTWNVNGDQEMAETATMITLGLWGKIGEMAAGENRNRRDGTVFNRRHLPATIEDIASENGFSVRQVGRGLAALKEAGWLLSVDEPRWREHRKRHLNATDDTPAMPATKIDAGNASDAATTERNGTGTERTGTNTGSPEKQKETSVPVPAEPACPTPRPARTEGVAPGRSSGHSGTRYRAKVEIARMYGLVPPAIDDKTPRASRTRSDLTTFDRMVDHVVTAAEKAEADRQATHLIQMAQEKRQSNLRNKIGAFVAAAKGRWGPWPGCKEWPDGKEPRAGPHA